MSKLNTSVNIVKLTEDLDIISVAFTIYLGTTKFDTQVFLKIIVFFSTTYYSLSPQFPGTECNSWARMWQSMKKGYCMRRCVWMWSQQPPVKFVCRVKTLKEIFITSLCIRGLYFMRNLSFLWVTITFTFMFRVAFICICTALQHTVSSLPPNIAVYVAAFLNMNYSALFLWNQH